MKLTKVQKTEKSKELADTLKGISHLIFTEYQGLKFQDMSELRAALKPMQCSYRVVKNSILSNALKQAGIPIADDKLLEGPNALLCIPEDDPVSPARVVAKFAKDNEALKVKAGYVDGAWLDAAQCRELSHLGTKPELLQKLASTLYSSEASIAWVVTAPIRELVMTLKALEDKKRAAEQSPEAKPKAAEEKK